MNGPSPTSGVGGSALKSVTLDQMCSGTMGMSRASMVERGSFVLMTRVRSSGAVTVSQPWTKLPFAVAAVLLVIMVLRVNAASLAVTGCPSDHFAPARMVKVQVSLSGLVSHFSARPGTGW
ncbi:hypothetical protein GCM10029964_057970 [Kibdelosporangium lantanae]